MPTPTPSPTESGSNPKDLKLTVTPEIQCCEGKKKITVTATATGPGAANAYVSIKWKDQQMGAYRTKTITYTPTDDDCGTSITFSATATDRPDRTIDALIAKVEFKSLKVIGKKNLVVGNDFGVDAKFESAVTITPTIPKAKVTDIFKFRLFQGVGSGYNRVRKTPPASWDTKHDYEGASDIAIIPNDDGTVQVNGTDDPFTQVLELTNPAISATTDFTANLYLQYKCGDSWKALGKVQWKWIGSWKNDGTTTGGVDTVEGAAFSGDVSLPPIPPKP